MTLKSSSCAEHHSGIFVSVRILTFHLTVCNLTLSKLIFDRFKVNRNIFQIFCYIFASHIISAGK